MKHALKFRSHCRYSGCYNIQEAASQQRLIRLTLLPSARHGFSLYTFSNQCAMKRNDKRNKIEEPFTPDRTPEPAQVVNPNEQPVDEKKSEDKSRDQKKDQERKPSDKKLGDPIEIDDETTI
jgi:hypothetical protein